MKTIKTKDKSNYNECGAKSRFAYRYRSAGFQPAVSQGFQPAEPRRYRGGFCFRAAADWKSAIQQVGNLRYGLAAAVVIAFSAFQGFTQQAPSRPVKNIVLVHDAFADAFELE